MATSQGDIIMKKNTKTMCVRTNIRAGKKNDLPGYGRKECMDKCKVNDPAKQCKLVCGRGKKK